MPYTPQEARVLYHTLALRIKGRANDPQDPRQLEMLNNFLHELQARPVTKKTVSPPLAIDEQEMFESMQEIAELALLMPSRAITHLRKSGYKFPA